MTESKTPLEHALDLFVYVPVGLAVTARDDFGGLVQMGRRQVEQQVRAARVVGELAVMQGRREVSQVIRQLSEALTGKGSTAGGHDEGRADTTVRAGAGAGPPPAPGSPPPPTPSTPGGEPVAGGATASGFAGRSTPPPSGAPSGSDLGIPGYDTLSASQVVQRLPALTPEELDAVAAYEQSTRGRRTILTRAAQLRSGQSET